MKYLVLKFAGPLQSWGSNSKYTSQRRTDLFPTKSGVVGLLAASLGIERSNVDGLQKSGLLDLNIAVREDLKGKLLSDYQIIEVDNGNKKISNKSYIADAIYLVAVYGNDNLIELLLHSVKNPKFTLFLGRKACVPEFDVAQVVVEYESVEQLLKTYPILTDKNRFNKIQRNQLELTLNIVKPATGTSGGSMVMDEPVSFASAKRIHHPRMVEYTTVTISNPYYIPSVKIEAHDPFDIIEKEK